MERQRDRVLSNLEGTCLYHNTDPAISDITYGPYTAALETESMTDVVVPNYHKRISAGEIINNPCSYSHSVYSTGSGSMRFEALTGNPNGYFYTLTGLVTSLRLDLNQIYGFHPAPAVNIDSSAKQKAIAGIDTTPFAFGEDLLELGETVKFLRKPIQSLLVLTTAFVKQVRRHPRYRTDLAKAIAEVWLTFRFAVSPLVLSAHAAIEAYTLTEKTLPPRLTSRGFDFGEASDSGYDIMSGRVTEWKSSRTLKNHAQILYQVSNPIHDWRWRLGVRNKDIPAAIWAVMPYSFMVDRVVDISSFITGIANLSDPNVRILSGSYTVRDEIVRELQLISMYTPGWSTTGKGEKITSKTFGYGRTPWAPTVLDTLPSFNARGIAESGKQLADVLALILLNVRGLTK